MTLPQEVVDHLSDMTLSMVYAPGVPDNITAVDLAAEWVSKLESNITTYNGYQIVDYVRNATHNETLNLEGAQEILEKYASLRSDIWPQAALAFWIIMLLVSTPMLALRLYSRQVHAGGLRRDDYVLIIGWAVAAANNIEDIYTMVAQNWDHHAWHATRSMLRMKFWITTVDDFLLPISAFFYKTALIIFFHDLYHPKPFRILCYFVEFLVFGWTIVCIVFCYIRCTPFNSWDDPFAVSCLPNFLQIYRAITILNIVNDLLILLLPMIITFNLKMPLKRKFGVACLMGLGSIVCVASIMRYTTLRYWLLTHDVMWRSIPVTTWSLLEPHLAIVCACVPPVWKLYNLTVKPKLRRPSAFTGDSSSSSGSSGVVKGVLKSFGSAGKKKRPTGDLTNIMNMKTDLETGVNGTLIQYDTRDDYEKDGGFSTVKIVEEKEGKVIGRDELRILRRTSSTEKASDC